MQANDLQQIVTPIIHGLGYNVVRVQIQTQKRINIQIMIERIDEFALSVDDCAIVSRHLSTIFETENTIKSQYVLEISSPGIDRPLMTLTDFQKFTGYIVQIKLHVSVNNTKKIIGRIMNIDNEIINIHQETIKSKSNAIELTHFAVNFNNISSAKLVLNDELLEKAQSGQLPGSKLRPEISSEEPAQDNQNIQSPKNKRFQKKPKKPVKINKDHKKRKENT